MYLYDAILSFPGFPTLHTVMTMHFLMHRSSPSLGLPSPPSRPNTKPPLPLLLKTGCFLSPKIARRRSPPLKFARGDDGRANSPAHVCGIKISVGDASSEMFCSGCSPPNRLGTILGREGYQSISARPVIDVVPGLPGPEWPLSPQFLLLDFGKLANWHLQNAPM